MPLKEIDFLSKVAGEDPDCVFLCIFVDAFKEENTFLISHFL